MDVTVLKEMFAGNWQIAAIIGAAYIVGLILKAIDDETVIEFSDKFGVKVGKVITLNIANWKYIGKIWNATVEPLVIDIIKDISLASTNFFVGLIKGLKSDNK